jgi:hypothetical protein
LNQPLNVLTLATGKKLYIDMAANLVRSFIFWNKDTGITFYLATDLQQFIPDDIKVSIKIIELQPDQFGKGFSPKLHLDKLAPAGQTLFIDSDCLIYGNLLHVFDQFNGHKVSVIGNYIATGDWFGDVAAICAQFNVAHLPKFNGGVYYLENGPEAVQVYDTARSLESKYDEIGFIRLRNRSNDEVLMALAMQLSAQTPIGDDGTILGEFVNFQSGIESDLVKGMARLYNTPTHQNYQKNWPLTIAEPLIVHFLGHHNQILPYTKEAGILRYISSNKYSTGRARLLTALLITLPSQIKTAVKHLLRPVYRSIMGTREVKTSDRVIS